MEAYTMSYDIKVWRVIKKGILPIPPKKDENGQVIVSTDPLDLDDYIDEQVAITTVNAKAKNLLYNAINGEECYECEKCGHVQANCPELKKKLSKNLQKKKYFGAWSDEEESDHEEIANMMFMAIKEDSNKDSGELGLMADEGEDKEENLGELGLMADVGTSEVKGQQEMGLEHRKKNQKGKWYLDSACSRHMTGGKQLFKTVTKLDGETITFGDKSKGNVIRVGRVPLSSIYDVDKVYLVDELSYNLLSISQLCDNDCEVHFKKHGWFIEDKSGKVILSGNRDRNVYTISNVDSLGDQICLTSMIDDT
ncbi:uncharacterized protein [Nicotiana sylvestris]|uniref:uncharacterized protein n=1 Tax=Nicotiana sylvestris TaxID=4096 RepID=UPI00388C4814